jgi:hypothetical protein
MSNTFTPPFSLFYGDKLSLRSFILSQEIYFIANSTEKSISITHTHAKESLTLMCKKYLFSIIEIEKRTFFRMCIKNLHLLLGFDDPWGVLSSLPIRQVSVIEPFSSFICVR